MKKGFVLFPILMAMSIVTFSCEESKLQKNVREFNRDCPIPIEGFGELSCLSLEDGYVVVNGIVNEGIMNIDALNNLDSDRKRELALKLFKRSSGGGMSEIAKAAEEEGTGLIYRYKEKETDKVFSVTLTHDDIVQMFSNDNSEEEDYEASLESAVELGNQQCPMRIDEGMVAIKMTIENRYVAYYISVDESLLPIEYMNLDKDEIKNNMLLSLKQPDRLTSVLIRMAGNTGRGIAYKFIGTETGDVCLIEFSPSELNYQTK